MPEIDSATVSTDVRRALEEDIRDGDRTASLIEQSAVMSTRVIARQEAVIAGRPWFEEVFRQLDQTIHIDWQINDGSTISRNEVLCHLSGPARGILTGERTGLNFLQTLSATATRTREYVDAVRGTGAKILDTRKTLPGLRMAQKYAVRCGGAINHRIGLFDAIMVKENHIDAAGSITIAVEKAHQNHPDIPVIVEVENIGQLEEAALAGADRVLLDNFSLRTLKKAAERFADKIKLEASGGITLDTVRAVAETGVHYISTGDITKSIAAVDMSMRFVKSG
jgi:nicotinate-nucleotide pyrophosphorylase (carboxylating)